MLNIQRILVPTDFSEASKAALEYATRMAEQFKASLDVIHVWEEPSFSGTIGADVVVHVPGGRTTLEELFRARASQALSRVLADIRRTSAVEPNGKLEMGDACDKIVRAASTGAYDLIVMGTHGRTGLSHMFLGSVAEKVVRRATCPVVTIRGSVAARVSIADGKSSAPHTSS